MFEVIRWFVLVIISTTAKRKSEMPDFTDTPERTRTTYLAVIRTYYVPTTRLWTKSLSQFLTYIQVSFFLWGFFEPILGCGIVVFGGQGSHQDISLECLQGYFHFPLLHSGEFLTSNERKTHVYRDNRRHSDNYRIVAQYHTHHHYCTTQR